MDLPSDSTNPDDDAETRRDVTDGDPSEQGSRGHSHPLNSPVEATLLRPAGATPLAIKPARPRWWTPLAVIGISLIAFLLSSSVLTVFAVVVVGGVPSSPADFTTGLAAAFESRIGLFVLVVLPQIAMVSAPILAAILSSVPTRRRLGLVRGQWPIWTWFAAAAATPLVGMVSGVVVGLFMEESDSLKQMTDIFRGHGENGFLIPLALMIGLTPAVCEEILFRGYVQTRMTRAVGPFLGIGIASFLFAAFHMDLVHVIAVFPLGLFLGWISWRSGSLFPAMLGHLVNNVISVVAVVLAPEDNPDVLALPAITFTISILGLGILGMGAVVAASIAYGRPDPDHRHVTMEAAADDGEPLPA